MAESKPTPNPITKENFFSLKPLIPRSLINNHNTLYLITDDRQRELDDILSDMLMTVNEIPDFRKKNSTITTTSNHSQKLQRSQSVIPAQTPQYLQVALPTASSSNTLNRNHRSQTHENISIPHQHHQVTRELLYDTASTATTITPPCSESGRDTPHQQHHASNTSIATITTRQKRDTFSGMASSSQPSNRSLSIQSLNYPQTVRTSQSTNNRISNSTTEDEDNIPYHAREHSQPFSYGNIIPNSGAGQEPDPRMIKAQTGLTSPTLVRKAFNNRLSSTSSTSNLSSSYNNPSTMRKTQIDSDFEDMLRERREKYSISDKPRSNGYQSHQHPQQSYYTTTETVRRTHQPLMDRSMSSEEWVYFDLFLFLFVNSCGSRPRIAFRYRRHMIWFHLSALMFPRRRFCSWCNEVSELSGQFLRYSISSSCGARAMLSWIVEKKLGDAQLTLHI